MRESELTRSSDWCPHPERWTAHDPQSAEVEVAELVAAFVRALQPELVIETGTAYGFTAAAIGEALKRNGHGHLHTLEIDRDCIADSRRRCTGLPVTVHACPSLDYEPEGEIGFAWFDSLIGLRLTEFDRFLPWMPPGAVVGFHDVAPQFGVWARDIVDHPALKPMFLRTPRGVCFAEVVC